MTPNQILGHIMTDDAYRNDDEKEEKKVSGTSKMGYPILTAKLSTKAE
jgi:hypothetical protein